MADIRGLVGDVVGGVLPREEGDPNVVRTSGGEPAEANGNTEIVQPQESVEESWQVAPPTEPALGSSEFTATGAREVGDSGEVGESFDPQHIILAQAGGGGARGGGGGRVPPSPRPSAAPGQQPAPSIGHNRPPVMPGLPQAIENYRSWFPPSSQPSGTRPLPDAAGPAAAAEEKAARERTDTYATYREHLQALDPDNPLLKLEPVLGVPPDQVIVDGMQKEVGAIVQRKLARFAWPNYPSKDRVHGIRNGAARELPGGLEQAEKDFAELSKRGTPANGPYGRDNVLNRRVQLPGTEMTVGIRSNRDGIPSLDIGSPETGYKKYHYK